MEAAKRNASQAGTGEANSDTNQTVVVDNTADATRKQVLEHAEHLAHLPLFDGAKSTAPSDELDLRPLFFQQSGAADPSRARDKAAGLAMIPTNEMPVTRSGFAPATMIALTIDFDDGNLDADDVQAATRSFFGSKTIAAAYSTASSLPESRRWRVVVPFSEALATNEWLRLGRGFARFCESAGIVVDKSMERVGQISFLPNVPFSLMKKDGAVVALRDPFSGAPLHFEHVRWGEHLFDAGALTDIATGVLQELDASDAAEAQKLAEQALERARKHDEREALRAQQLAAGMDTLTPVERFKVEHSTESLLAKYGYIEDPQKPGNWRSPLQTSGTFATQVREDGSWFSLSGSDADAGLGTAQAGGRGGDAFDLFAFFEHGGNYRKAVAAVSPPVGGDITAFAGVPVTQQVPLRQDSAPAAGNARYKLKTFADLKASAKPLWLVSNVLPTSGLAAIYGPSGSGKSFLAMQMGLSIAGASDEWFGHKVREHRPVIYMGLEGAAGVKLRLEAYAMHNDCLVPDSFRVVSEQQFNLASPTDTADLIESIRSEFPDGAVVFIDTLNRASEGVDENSGKEMTLIYARAMQIQESLRGLVVIVTHTGKDEAKGVRGHSSQFAALDAAIAVSRNGEAREWKLAKAKDGEDGLTGYFTLTSRTLGYDDEGAPISSAVVSIMQQQKNSVRHKPNEDKALGALMSAMEANPNGVTIELWKHAFCNTHCNGNMKSKREAFNTASKALVDGRFVTQDGGFFRLATGGWAPN